MKRQLFIWMLAVLILTGISGDVFETINFRNSDSTLVINTHTKILTYNSKDEKSTNYNYDRIYFIGAHIFITLNSVDRCTFFQQKNGLYKSDLYISGKHFVERKLKRY